MSKSHNRTVTPVTPHPRYGSGIKRLNKNPLLIFAIIALIVFSVFAYTLYKKSHHPRHLSAEDEKTAQSSPVPEGIFEHPTKNPPLSRPTSAPKEILQKPQKTQQAVPYALTPRTAAWDHYFGELERLRQQRAQRLIQALQAPPDSGNQSDELANLYRQIQKQEQTNRPSLPQDTDYLDSYRTGARNGLELKEGTILPLVLVNDLNSDVPSLVKAQIRENIFDNATASTLLIPQGTILIGRFQPIGSANQSRLNLRFERLIFPDQSTLDLDDLQAVDLSGEGGLRDKVNRHWGPMLSSAGIGTFFELLQSPATLFSNNMGTSVGSNTMLGSQVGETGQQITQRNRNLTPTLTIRAGYLFNVFIAKDIILPAYEDRWGNSEIPPS